MTCKCGHIKKHHQYERDTQDKTGQCGKTEITNDKKLHPCGCKLYSNLTVQTNYTEGKN